LNHYREAIRSRQTISWTEVSAYPAGLKVGEVSVKAVYDAMGVPTHLLGIVHDVTERERLETSLRLQQERLAFLLRLNDALRPLSDPAEMQDVTVRLLGEYLHVNRVAYSVIEGEEFIVTTSYDDGVKPFRGRWPIRDFGAALLDAYRRGESVSVTDVRTDHRLTDAERANLLTGDISAFLRVMIVKQGRWVATFGVNSVTPRHWTRDEVAVVEEAAERMWSAAERKRLEQERSEEAQRKDEFLAFLGHELRNPLAAIQTANEVLSSGATEAQRVKMAAIIGRQTTMMRRLVDDLLELERITHGHIELQREQVNLGECLQQSVASMQATVASRRQELHLHLPSGTVLFMADRTRLDQIIGNLLTNASKYTGPGGRIELSGAREGVNVVLRCKDNGRGVLPEFQEKIFQPFFRGTTTDLGYGEASLGLGLALTKHLTELHGGTLVVASGGADQGSEFVVRLPLVAPPSDQQATPESTLAPTARRPYSVVIVEDNPSVGEALMIALEQAGHVVHLFADGPSALAGLSALSPDAFLIDIGLPGMDGYEVAAKLRTLGSTRNALYIAVSGFKQPQSGQAGSDFDHYLNKPFAVGTLLALLDSELIDRQGSAGREKAR
jgi:signal transduction histidine kinase